MKRPTTTLLPLLAFAACLAPGADITPLPGDFAFVEIQLQG